MAEKSAFERSIAEHHLQRYLRPYRRAKAFFLIVALPSGVSSLVWKDAAMAWAKPADDAQWRYKEPVFVASVSVLDDLPASRERVIVLVEYDDRDDLLKHVTVSAADAVIDIGELDPKLIQLAFRDVVGGSLSHSEAVALAAMPASHRRLASLSGRSAATTVARLVAAKKLQDLSKSETKAEIEKKTSSARLEDLHGYGDAKAWGLDLARDIADYRAGLIQWSDVDSGLLLSGPPGVGKTRFAAALAETCGIPIVSTSFARWQAKGHQGDALKAMHLTFEAARRAAPCLMFIDEVDNFIDRDRNSDSSDYMRGIVNGLLEELDGADGREGVVVVGACNNADIVDPALRRSGRLDRHIELSPPDAGARVHILRHYLGVDLDVRPYLRRTEGMTGADLERAARDARRMARREGIDLEARHLIAALPARAPRPHQNLRLTACHEVGHAVVGAVLGAGRLLHVYLAKEYDPSASASVAGAAVFRIDPHEHRTADKHRDLICAKFAGMAAEEMYFGSHGEGCVADLEEATALATYMFATLGMGNTLSSSGHRDPQALTHARMIDPALASAVETLLQEQAARARQILEERRDAVDELVELLILRGSLKAPEVLETIRSYEMGPSLPKAV
ncbi:AAA family ATPase [Sinorhizobium meliloti]|uniref:AAA family ATPase n=1 Tax=Rhizobium meliloti TaxID=382 RepID=UPI000FD946CE|nr:AAA family ATPase [Sinorhizobium meliloti]RVO68379.1 AAA family ATPase [Sinorhizobium meliloti]